MSLFRFLFQRARARILIGIVAGVLAGLSSAAALALVKPALAEAGAAPSWLVLFAVAVAANVVLAIVSERIACAQAQDLLAHVRLDLTRRILAAPLVRLEQIGVPRLLAALTEDVSAIGEALPGVAQFCPQVAIIIGCLAYMLWLAPWGFVLVAGTTAVGLLVYTLPQRLAMRALHASRADADVVLRHLRALAEGIKQLQMHQGRAAHFFERALIPATRSSRDNSVRAFGMHAIGSNVGRAFFPAAILVVLVFGPRLGMGRPTMVALALAVLYLTRPAEVLLSWLPIINIARVAVSRLQELMLELHVPAASGSAPSRQPLTRHLELRRVTYTHRGPGGDAFTVGPLDLTLTAGELVFLVGGNGSGKTTLAKLLIGLYRPDSGVIAVDGVAADDLDAYRANFSVILADAFAFDDLGIESTPASLDRAARQVGPLGFSLDRARGGAPLSRGQGKRLLLLSSMIEDRPVYVFDEWAAEQDPAFRETFYTEVLPALRARGKIVFVISHDDRYFPVADRVLRLDYGQLVPPGRLSTAAAPQVSALRSLTGQSPT